VDDEMNDSDGHEKIIVHTYDILSPFPRLHTHRLIQIQVLSCVDNLGTRLMSVVAAVLTPVIGL
jgi:hypothetical protein